MTPDTSSTRNCTALVGTALAVPTTEAPERLEMGTDDYRERPVGSLGPNWAPGRGLGAHTYTFDGSWEATDCLGLVSRLRR